MEALNTDLGFKPGEEGIAEALARGAPIIAPAIVVVANPSIARSAYFLRQVSEEMHAGRSVLVADFSAVEGTILPLPCPRAAPCLRRWTRETGSSRSAVSMNCLQRLERRQVRYLQHGSGLLAILRRVTQFALCSTNSRGFRYSYRARDSTPGKDT